MVLVKAKQKAGEFFLKKLSIANKRKPKSCGLMDAKTIGILYNASESGNREIVKKFVSKLKEDKKNVSTLGYFSQKEMAADTLAKLDFDYFSKKDINWHLRPYSKVISNFCNESFDILINLSTHTTLPIEYVFVMSKSNFKVGRAGKKHLPFYDLSILAPEDADIKQLIDIFTKYLNMIHS